MAWFPSPKEEYLLAAASWLDPEWDKSIPNTQTTSDYNFYSPLVLCFLVWLLHIMTFSTHYYNFRIMQDVNFIYTKARYYSEQLL